MTNEIEDERLRALLLTHPAVAAVHVRRDGATRLASVVPRAETAAFLSRACDIEDRLPPRLHLFDVEGGLPLVGINKSEAGFLCDEILAQDCYLLGGELRLPDRPTVVDVGANIGVFAVVVGRRYPGARILAVEPIPLLCSAIQSNAQLHNIGVDVANVAAADVAGHLDLHFYPSNTVMSGIRTNGSGAEATLRNFLSQQNPGIDAEELEMLVEECLAPEVVRCRADRLTDLLRNHCIETVDLLKVDAEHSEVQVLQGIDDPTWSSIDRVVVEVHDVDSRLDHVSELLKTRGFSITVIDSALEETGCWMVAGKKAPCNREPSQPRTIERELTKVQLLSDLADFLRAQGEPTPDRMFILSQARLSETMSTRYSGEGASRESTGRQ